MSLIEIIRQTDSHTFLSPQTRKFHKLGQFVVPAWTLRQPRLKTGILLATLISLAVLSASSTVAFSAANSQGVAGVSANSIGFGSVVVNTTSPAQHVALENTGSASLSLMGMTFSGTYASRFAQSNNCGSLLAPGASCTISLTFSPNTPGQRFATLIIWTNGWGGRKNVSLNGVGVAGGTPAAGLSPGSLAFGSQPVGKTTGAGTATLDNAGTAALSISSVTITGANPGDFVQANNCGSSLPAGSSCTFNITFTPAASGSRTALLSVADNSASSPQTVSLSGTGTVASASLSPTGLSFGNQPVNAKSGTLTATLTNGGAAALSLSSIALTGANAGDFAQSNTCGTSVAAGASCTVSVTFDPTASGSRSASVSFTDNANGSPQSLGLSGTGTSATVSLSPSSLSFTNQPISVTSSAQIVTLTNGGSTALSISSLTITGTNAADFAEVANTCGSSVAAGANCSIGVAFTPSTSNSETASLAIADNATGSPQKVSLSGLGIHNVGLLWTPSSTSGVVGYNVYRGTTSGGENSTPLNSTPISGTTFTDESVTAGSTYYYVVTAVGSDDTQSPASAESSTTVPST
jgi:archaellum component FlaF (FlaF/FlaG flagellin family)